MLEIELVYGTPHKQVLLAFSVPEGSSIEESITLSGIVTHFPNIIANKATVGIFGRSEALHYQVKAGDRIEIYRPLIADPKELRKLRASKMLKNN